MKKALIIATPTAINGYRSGAELRIETLRNILISEDFDVYIETAENGGRFLESSWDLIILCSFKTLTIARLARKHTKLLWFDPYDSWTLNRLSRFKHGESRQLAALSIDFFWVKIAPRFDIITFISRRDMNVESQFVEQNHGSLSFVLPNKLRILKLNANQMKRIVFIGDLEYPPNEKAVKFLCRAKRELEIELPIEIIGKRNVDLRCEDLLFKGYVPDDALYQQNDIHIVPIFEGSGIKNKVVEPLSLNLPVLTTSEGAVGIKRLENLYLFNEVSDLPKFLGLNLPAPPLDQVQKFDIYLDDQTQKVIDVIKN